MHVYECTAENESIAEYIDGYARYEPDNIWVFIFARSHGQARAIFCREYDFEFTSKISVRKVAHDVAQLDTGFANFDEWLPLSKLDTA